jgi:hypothetical protein
MEFATLLGKTLVSIQGMEAGSGNVYLTTSDGIKYHMHHEQDCCEHVSLESVVGDPEDLLDEPLLMAEEVESLPLTEAEQEAEKSANEWGSSTWTFYKLATRKGYVDLRWFGSSNGYYGEGVDFHEFGKDRWAE